MQGHEPQGSPANSVNADQAWASAFAPAPRASILSSARGNLPGVRASHALVSTASGAAIGSEAGLGLTAAGSEQRSRESLTLLGVSSPGSLPQRGSLLSGTGGGGAVSGRPSSAAYRTGRLSALPAGLGSSSPGQLQAASPGLPLRLGGHMGRQSTLPGRRECGDGE
jgi:hypothetical protein